MNEQQAIAAAIRVVDAMVETDAKLDAQASAATHNMFYNVLERIAIAIEKSNSIAMEKTKD